MFDDWWKEILSLVGGLLTAILAWLRYHRYELPVVAIKPYSRAADSSQALDFDLEVGADKWRVSGVRIRGLRWPCLAPPGKAIFPPQIAMIAAYEKGGSWQPSLQYDPPVSHGIFVRHPHAPSDEQVLFTVVLRSNPRVRRRVVGSVMT